VRIGIVTPAPAGSRKGNRITALRWARLLRQLGHHVELASGWDDQDWDILFALHARRSAAAVRAFDTGRPGRPIVVVLTGTDLYQDLPGDPDALDSLRRADRIVTLQPLAAEAVPADFRERVRPILQSASAPSGPSPAPVSDAFEVCVIGHLREVKDPLLTALASRHLPAQSRLRVLQLGGALEPSFERAAREEMAANPRYHWLGALPRIEMLEVLRRCRLLVLTSRLEGGANVISEALACGVPVVSTRIPGSVGLLGADHPGYFPVGDDVALASLLTRCETDTAFLSDLAARCAALAWTFEPVRERRALRVLLSELSPRPSPDRLEIVDAAAAVDRTELAQAVRDGLGSRPRHLPCRYFYDDEGSLLFEAICELPEYELPRVELEILRARAGELAALMPPGAAVAELGGGNARKTRLLLAPLLARGPVRYLAVDISRSALEEAARALLADLPGLAVTAVHGDYEAAFAHLGTLSPKLVLWLGSNIGNLDRQEAAAFLARVGATMRGEDRLLVGIDLRKPAAVLERAYDDSRGITARFNRNLLIRLNRELDADFDPTAFAHRVRYDEVAGRIEMYLVATRAMRVRAPGADLELELERGEAIHTEDSYKYSLAEIAALGAESGLGIERLWTDERDRFASVLFAASPSPQRAIR
jgi:dimethylhistidine N-methyltransferase